jgi:hypothetical protein
MNARQPSISNRGIWRWVGTVCTLGVGLCGCRRSDPELAGGPLETEDDDIGSKEGVLLVGDLSLGKGEDIAETLETMMGLLQLGVVLLAGMSMGQVVENGESQQVTVLVDSKVSRPLLHGRERVGIQLDGLDERESGRLVGLFQELQGS